MFLQHKHHTETWTDREMLAAIDDVKQGMSCNKAADAHCVPRSTLKDRISGRVIHGRNPGPVCYLSSEEESLLADYLLKASDMGYGKTRRDVCCIVESYLKQKGSLKGERVSNGWWDKFLRRNPTLRLRIGDSTAGVRFDAINTENMDNYFKLLKDTYDQYDFSDNPECIFRSGVSALLSLPSQFRTSSGVSTPSSTLVASGPSVESQRSSVSPVNSGPAVVSPPSSTLVASGPAVESQRSSVSPVNSGPAVESQRSSVSPVNSGPAVVSPPSSTLVASGPAVESPPSSVPLVAAGPAVVSPPSCAPPLPVASGPAVVSQPSSAPSVTSGPAVVSPSSSTPVTSGPAPSVTSGPATESPPSSVPPVTSGPAVVSLPSPPSSTLLVTSQPSSSASTMSCVSAGKIFTYPLI